MGDDNIYLTIAQKYKYQIFLLLGGLILIGFGVLFSNINWFSSPEIEVIETTDASETEGEIYVEVSGSIENPSVYKLPNGSRIEDALNAAGGLSDDADNEWIERFVNRAAKITDGQKIYIPSLNDQSSGVSANNIDNSGRVGGVSTYYVNINTASQSELESLWGIGPVTAQNIIEQRPYSSVQELVDKKIIKSNVYERNKDKLSVF